MGSRLAESIDEEGTGAANFLTRNLWGMGSTAPYLAFLNNLVLFKVDEEDLVVVPPPRTVRLSPFLRFGRR